MWASGLGLSHELIALAYSHAKHDDALATEDDRASCVSYAAAEACLSGNRGLIGRTRARGCVGLHAAQKPRAAPPQEVPVASGGRSAGKEQAFPRSPGAAALRARAHQPWPNFGRVAMAAPKTYTAVAR